VAPAIATPTWLRYPALVRVSPRDGEVIVVGDDEAAVRRLVRAVREPPAPPPSVSCAIDVIPDGEEHVRRVARARELILAGELYQVNLARRFGFAVNGVTEPLRAAVALQMYERATHASPCRFGAVVMLPEASVVSLSPELLLRAESREGRFVRLRTEPIKGTRPRGEDAASDRALAAELDADPKERAELAMIVDVVKNDLGSVCEVGSVRIAEPPHVVTHRTVHHREASLVGRVRAGIGREDVISALVPSGSVTGAPKVRAMEVIAELEDERRGLYTGGIGHVTRGGGMTLSMAIRTLVFRGERGWYWSGGGIVADSDPQRELEETEWKAQRLFRALG
jgi:anthranilate/para-aminobenzoate synthase component I